MVIKIFRNRQISKNILRIGWRSRGRLPTRTHQSFSRVIPDSVVEVSMMSVKPGRGSRNFNTHEKVTADRERSTWWINLGLFLLMRKPSMIASLRLNNADWLICFRHFKDIPHRAVEFTGFNIVLSNHMGGQHNKSEFVIQMITMVDWCIRASPRINRSKRTGRYRIHDEYFFSNLRYSLCKINWDVI